MTGRLRRALLGYLQVGLLLFLAATADRPVGWLAMACAWATLDAVERPRSGRHFATSRRQEHRDVGEMMAAYLAWIENDVAARFETTGA